MSDNPMEFMAAGVLVLNTLSPELRSQWHSELFREIWRRGGLTDDGKYVDKAIAGELFSEIVERATRNFANELTERTRKYMSEGELERLEIELGNSLRRVLDHIASKWS